MDQPFLQVRDVRKQFGSTAALDGVSFHVNPGEVFGLLGPNGAGKTTLLSIISCLLNPTSGEARLEGEVLAVDNRQIRRRLGIVPQELAIYDELTASENLEFFGKLYGLRGPTLRRRVESVLAAVGLEDRAARRVETFSGGMKRRLNLGAALIHEPKLLLLDEPTTGVDPQSRNHLFEEIRRVHREGATIVYTSHYMGEVEALCSRIGVMDNGKLVACDTLPNILRVIPGVIRFRVPAVSAQLLSRLEQLPKLGSIKQSDNDFSIECTDVKDLLVRLVGVLNELKLELTGLEIEEPNLERVFLHLTGRALRD